MRNLDSARTNTEFVCSDYGRRASCHARAALTIGQNRDEHDTVRDWTLGDAQHGPEEHFSWPVTSSSKVSINIVLRSPFSRKSQNMQQLPQARLHIEHPEQQVATRALTLPQEKMQLQHKPKHLHPSPSHQSGSAFARDLWMRSASDPSLIPPPSTDVHVSPGAVASSVIGAGGTLTSDSGEDVRLVGWGFEGLRPGHRQHRADLIVQHIANARQGEGPACRAETVADSWLANPEALESGLDGRMSIVATVHGYPETRERNIFERADYHDAVPADQAIAPEATAAVQNLAAEWVWEGPGPGPADDASDPFRGDWGQDDAG